LVRSAADIAVAVTGIAGPTGGSPDKPVGLVHLAVARREGAIRHRREVFSGNRADVREQTVAMALEMIRECVEEAS
jgi:nicotinamide-nucleotide amidase